MKKRLLLFLVIGFCIFLALVFRPCANGIRIVLLNATSKNIKVTVYDEKEHYILLQEMLEQSSGIKNYRIYIPGDVSYNLEVIDVTSGKLLYKEGAYGYASPHLTQTDFFMIGDEDIHYDYWLPQKLWVNALTLGLDGCSCLDNFITNRIPIKKP